MKTYKFKTKEEFIEKKRWNHNCNTPLGWSSSRNMNEFLGELVPVIAHGACRSRTGFILRPGEYSKEKYKSRCSWSFSFEDYKEINISEINNCLIYLEHAEEF